MPAISPIMDAARALLRGELVAFPTDTVYGLACLATDPAARARFYAVKQRPAGQPSILMVADTAAAAAWVDLDDQARRLAGEHWPGPLTLVLRATRTAISQLGDIVREGTVAVRIPDHPVALELLRAVGAPLCTSSANRAGDPPPLTAADAGAALEGEAVLVLEGEPGSGRPSSILDLTGPEPRLLRQGAIPAARLLP